MTKLAPDWETIEAAYRAGQLSIRAIAKCHGITDATIRKRAKRSEWKRDASVPAVDRVASGDRKRKKVGRPSTFNPGLAKRICERIMLGEPVRQICLLPGMPHERAVYRWLSSNDEFRQDYPRAKQIQADRWAEEIIEIADDGRNDWVEREGKDGSTYVTLNAEAVMRSKLRVETRKWLMSRFAPKRYGDKVAQELSGPDGGAVQIESNYSVDDDSQLRAFEAKLDKILKGDDPPVASAHLP